MFGIVIGLITSHIFADSREKTSTLVALFRRSNTSVNLVSYKTKSQLSTKIFQDLVMAFNLTKWNVEDTEFWECIGKSIVTRNLWISIPSLLFGFSVWLYWGIITLQILNLGYPFGKEELFNLGIDSRDKRSDF